jgi:hypothetical protein
MTLRELRSIIAYFGNLPVSALWPERRKGKK